MPTDAPDAAEADVLGRVASLLRRADLALLAAKERPLREVGMSGSLYAVLMNVRVSPGLTGAELSRVVGVTPQAITPLVAKLVSRGWLERRTHPRHRNVQELHLTADGHRKLDRADQIMFDLEGHVRGSLGDADHEHLAQMLVRVITCLGDWTPPADPG